MSKPTIKHVQGPGEKQPKAPQAAPVAEPVQALAPVKTPVDTLLGICLMQTKLLEALCAEMRYTTPSHTWHKLDEITGDIVRFLAELDQLVASRDAAKKGGVK
jgi:hypothetical protein